MNVLMIIERYAPIWGGAENQLQQLADCMVAFDCTSIVATRRWTADLSRYEKVDGITVCRLGVPGEGNIARFLFIVALIAFALRRRSKFDIIHSHGAIQMGAVVSVIARCLNKKSIAKIATAGHARRLRGNVLGGVVLKCFKNVDAVIAMTEEIVSEMLDIGLDERQIVRIANGVDCERFMPMEGADRRELRKRHGFGEDELLLIFSGRLVQRKGIDMLIEAWIRRPTALQTAQLLIVGSGRGQFDSVENTVRQKVEREDIAHIHFIGEVSQPEYILSMADIFVFPSRLEGFPNALLEAMAAGVAVIGSNIGGVTDLVDDGIDGLLFEKDDIGSLLEKMALLAKNAGLRKRLGQQARRSVCGRYSLVSTAHEYMKLYHSLLQPKHEKWM
jgi:glycosyltransferase involved in cell wall biosynthesis